MAAASAASVKEPDVLLKLASAQRVHAAAEVQRFSRAGQSIYQG